MQGLNTLRLNFGIFIINFFIINISKFKFDRYANLPEVEAINFKE